MSENIETTVEAPAVRVIHITSKDEFVKVATEYGITVGERGNLPKRALFAKVLNDIVAGTVKLIPTDFLNPSVQNTTPRATKVKPIVSYKITYKVVSNGTLSVEDFTVKLTENEVRSYLPHVKGQVGFAFATMVLALHNADEESSVGELLLSYAVSDVERVESVPVVAVKPVEKTEDAPKGDDTGEQVPDADKATETPEEIKPDEAPNLVTPEADVPVVEIKTETVDAKPAAKPRARKTAKANA